MHHRILFASSRGMIRITTRRVLFILLAMAGCIIIIYGGERNESTTILVRARL